MFGSLLDLRSVVPSLKKHFTNMTIDGGSKAGHHDRPTSVTCNSSLRGPPDNLEQLIQLGDLIHSSIRQYVDGKRKLETVTTAVGEAPLPHAVFSAQRNLIAAAGKLTELVVEPGTRLQETSIQYMESRALQILADARVPDALAASDHLGGTHIDVLASEIKIERRKLGQSHQVYLVLSSSRKRGGQRSRRV